MGIKSRRGHGWSPVDGHDAAAYSGESIALSNLGTSDAKVPSVSSRNQDPLEQRTAGDSRFRELPMWNPLWLRSAALLAISASLACLAIILAILWQYSNVNNGFPIITMNHYSWTYGPTLVLVIVVGIWRQVDFHCKSLTPWVTLRRGDAKASDSMTADYVSPFQAVSFLQAYSRSHFTIAATILGFVLLKLTTIASTDLLIMTATNITLPNFGLLGTTQLDGLLVNTSEYASSPTLFDPSIVYTAYGVMSRGLPYAEGTKPGLVYETFRLPQSNDKANATVSATVSAFIPRLSCEEVDVVINLEPPDSTDEDPMDAVNITSTSCVLGPESAQPTVHVLNPREDLAPPRQLAGSMTTVNCTNTPYSGEQIFILTDIHYNQTLVKSPLKLTADEVINATSWSTEVKQVTSILCWPSYSIEEVLVTYDTRHNPPSITVDDPLTTTNHTWENIKNKDLSNLFTAALSPVATTFGDIITEAADEEYPSPMFKMMEKVNGGGYEALLDANAMSEAAKTVFENIAVQIVHKDLLRQHDYPVSGEITYLAQRLQFRNTSFVLVLCGFTTMIFLSLYVFFTKPMDTVPRAPEPIASTALILTNSSGLQTMLQGSSQMPWDMVCEKLDRHRFSTTLSNGPEGNLTFGILASKSEEMHDMPSVTVPQARLSYKQWWEPLWIRTPLLVSIFCLILALIVILEVLQRISDDNNGIVSMPAVTGILATTTTHWLPALIMVLAATSFNAIDFTISTFAPYHALKSNSVPARRGLMGFLVGKMPPHALWTSLSHRYWGALFSTTAAVIGSFLTIIVSGLYTVNEVSTSVPFRLQSVDSFDTKLWADSATNDDGAAIVTTLTENLNLTYPPFTYDELAFPGLSSIEPTSMYCGSYAQTTVTASIPALRASLQCVNLDHAQFNVTSDYDSHEDDAGVNIQGRIPLPQGCLLGGEGGNLSYIDFGFEMQSSANSSYFGSMTDLHVGPFDGIVWGSSDENDAGAQPDNPPGCPSLAFTHGYFDVTDTFEAAQSKVTTMYCYQQMQQLMANVTFIVPGLSISATYPPIPDEATVKLMSSGPNDETSFEYRPQLHFDDAFLLFNQTQYSTDFADLGIMDNFFQGVLFGKQPIPQTALTGEKNAETAMKGIQGLYRRYMAQAISTNMRRDLVDDANTQIFTGTILNHNNPRLFQNNASKITLQVFLGVMFVFGLVAVTLTSTKRTLPHNPWTIAGVASLMAGSEMCGESMRGLVPASAQWMSDKELERNHVWHGWLFSLGWWDWKWGEQRRWGIDVGRAEGDG